MHSKLRGSSPRVWALVALGSLAGCGRTGQELVRYDLYAVGGATIADAGQWHVELTQAQLGVGPIYFCATETASMSLCPSAVNEFATAASFNALSKEPVRIGEVTGTSGEIRSMTMDFAITWLTTQRAPTPTPAAPNGHSALFAGRATKDAIVLHFVLGIDIKPSYAGTRAVQGTRVQATVAEGQVPERATLAIDAPGLFSTVDFDDVATLSGDPIEIPKDSRAYSAVLTAMTTTGLPTFAWTAQTR